MERSLDAGASPFSQVPLNGGPVLSLSQYKGQPGLITSSPPEEVGTHEEQTMAADYGAGYNARIPQSKVGNGMDEDEEDAFVVVQSRARRAKRRSLDRNKKKDKLDRREGGARGSYDEEIAMQIEMHGNYFDGG